MPFPFEPLAGMACSPECPDGIDCNPDCVPEPAAISETIHELQRMLQEEDRPMLSEALSIYAEVAAERRRAHVKHGETSMERLPVTDMTRLSVLMEEVGEVAREFNEARHRAHLGLLPEAERVESIDIILLRKELIQVAAVAVAWADALTVV